MDDIPSTYNLESIEQMRAIADPLRMRIYQVLTLRAMTATQVAEELGEAPPKIHYHVRELERVGLVSQVDTRERGGILEKYFRAIANGLRVPPTLLQQSPPDQLAAAMNDFFNSVASSFQTAMNRLLADSTGMIDNNPLTLSNDAVWMTTPEFEETLAQALALFKPYYERRGVEGEREIALTVIGYVARLASQDADVVVGKSAQAEVASAPPPKPTVAPQSAQVSGKDRTAVLIGAVSYSRRELEDLAERGDKLDLTVIGRLTFPDEVSADLIERTIARIKLYGVVSAAPQTRAALQKKEV